MTRPAGTPVDVPIGGAGTPTDAPTGGAGTPANGIPAGGDAGGDVVDESHKDPAAALGGLAATIPTPHTHQTSRTPPGEGVLPSSHASQAQETLSGGFLYEVREVFKSYGSVVALDGVSMGIRPGEVLGLVGDNGAGKSTLVKVLSGAHQPDTGRILLEGVERKWKSPHDVLEAGIETLYQDSGLAPNLSIGANVFLGREIPAPGVWGRLGFLAQRRMDREAHEDLERVGIGVAAADRTVAELSGGQRQAVAIGRAVAWARKVIILDEPTNHLGARQANEVLDVIRAAKDKDLAVIFISHTLPHVLDVCDRIIVMRLGRIVRDAPTTDFNTETLLGTITGLIAT